MFFFSVKICREFYGIFFTGFFSYFEKKNPVPTCDSISSVTATKLASLERRSIVRKTQTKLYINS